MDSAIERIAVIQGAPGNVIEGLISAFIARRAHVAYPVVLVIGGLVLSLIPETPDIRLQPNLIFYGVLPPLLYSAAWFTSWRDFSHHLVSILSLAFGLVIFTILGVAVTAQWLFPGFDWRIGIILGAVVAPTDPIAATAIASRLGLPRRILDVLEGESLINDATALVAVELGTALVVANIAPHFGAGVGRFAYVTCIGALVGATIALAVDWVERRIDDAPIEMAISLIVPYTVYLTADAVHRVQAARRVLEDHGDLPAAHPVQNRHRRTEQLLPVQHDAAGHLRLAGQQAERREPGDRLAAAGFADEADSLTRAHRQVHAPQHRDAVESDAQPGHADERFVHQPRRPQFAAVKSMKKDCAGLQAMSLRFAVRLVVWCSTM